LWQGNKAASNISRGPLPDIGSVRERWPEYRPVVRTAPLIHEIDYQHVAAWLDDLPRPIVCLHTIGNTGQQSKSLPRDRHLPLYRSLLEQLPGTLILLDWDARMPRLASWRVRHLTDLPGGCPTPRLMTLLDQADLLIGIDSGPLHACSLTDTPTLGLWHPGHYPARYTLPREQSLHLVLADKTRAWNKWHRLDWNIVELPGEQFAPDSVARHAAQLLAPPRYLDRAHPCDVQLQHWVRTLCRGGANSLSPVSDRQLTFDAALRLCTARFPAPRIVETGCIRAEEDWGGAGFSTYLFARYVSALGRGHLDSVDLTPAHTAFARRWCQFAGERVHIHTADAVSWLQACDGPIDLLYLDSLDTDVPGHAEHCLRELQTALPNLHDQSLVLIDDSPWSGGPTGKGALAIPWLRERGWHLLASGYQALLSLDPRGLESGPCTTPF
jgi:hypothetical protein